MLKSEINESKFTNTLAALGLAANVANANIGMKPVVGTDTRYGSSKQTLFQVRHNHKFDAQDFNYKFKNLPDSIAKIAHDSLDIEHTIAKILATPDSILSKYGKTNAKVLAKYVVEAADKYDIDENILLAMLSTETGFNQNAVSHTGVRSIAQITTNTFNSLKNSKKIDSTHSMKSIRSDVKSAIYAAANMISYFSAHMHNNIEMIFAEYNGGAIGGASPYRMLRQGKSKKQIIKWMKENGCSANTIEHFFGETVQYVQKCMKMYKYYLSLDETKTEKEKQKDKQK